jgi:N,N'-diacetyllegionaminate synthase
MNHFVDKIIQANNPYVIAEAGINHNGDVNLAKEMIVAAYESGADCIKFQSFIADKYISKKAGKAAYQKQSSVQDKSQYEIIKSCEISKEGTKELFEYTKKIDIDFLSTPFELWSFRMLMELKVPAIKISSCNLTNYPFLKEVAQSKIPVLLSTGMSNLTEVTKAVEIFKESGSPFILFQCTSNYPSKIENANLRVIPLFRHLFDVPVGFSDHTPTATAAIAAVALGAVAIEKHFTLSRGLPGIDQKASIEPKELKQLVTSVRECYAALGSPLKKRTDEEEETRIALRRSLVASRDINAGEVLNQDMVAIKRPGNGLPPDFLPQLLGRKLTRSVKEDEILRLDDFLS